MLSDFGAARQFGWEKATCDYVMWLDSDDVVEHGEKIPEIVRDMSMNQIDRAMLNYDYAHDASGNVTCKLKRERILRRSAGARWALPVHEALTLVGREKSYDLVNIVHRRAKYAKLTSENFIHHRNLKILLRWCERHGNEALDPRMIFYLAMEERYLWPDKAIEDFSRHCRTSGWDEERGLAHVMSGLLHESAGRYEEAFAEYAQCDVEFPSNPDGMFGCARVAYFKRQWNKVVEYTDRGFKMMENPTKTCLLMHDPLDRTYKPYIYLSAALVELQMYERAIEICDKGLKINPNDPYLKGNRETSEKNLAQRKQAPERLDLQFSRDEPLDTPPMSIPINVLEAFAIQMWKMAVGEGQPERALRFLDDLPSVLTSLPKIQEARNVTIGTMKREPDQTNGHRKNHIEHAIFREEETVI